MMRSKWHLTSRSKLWFTMVFLGIGISAVALGLNQLSMIRDLLLELPNYPVHTPSYLGVKTLGSTVSSKNAVQIVKFATTGDVAVEVTDILSEPWEIIDCPDFEGTLCAVEQRDGDYDLYRWNSATKSGPITETGQVAGFERVVAAAPLGVFTAQMKAVDRSVDSISFTPQEGPQTSLLGGLNEDCGKGPALSPTGKYIATLCLRQQWYDYLQGKQPRPVDEQIHVVKLSDTSLHELITATTYLWGPIMSMNLPVPPSTPEWQWSPDGAEIAFVASFSPPVEAPLEQALAGSASRYKTFSGIYSITLNGVLHKWIDVGDQNPKLTWSPDKMYLAYALPVNDQIYLVSRAGQYRPIGQLHHVSHIAWSPDGGYIAAIADHTLWVLSTSDYHWQQVGLPGQVSDLVWLMPSAH
jgi:hypothetical protein